MRKFSSLKRDASASGFSLVEVTLALGIVVVALTSMVGLFPTGLSTLRSAKNATVEAQIVEYMGATATLSAFSNLNQPFTESFDQDGTHLADSTSNNVRYRAAAKPVPVSLPGTSAFSSNDALCLQIVVTWQPGPNAPAVTSSSYSIQIANSGK